MERVEQLRMLAENGWAEAQWALGLLFEHGFGVARDSAVAAQWYRRAAQSGLAVAQLDLANLYWRGEGVAKDEREGNVWLRRAAENAHPWAQYLLAMYILGSQLEEDPTLWLIKAADGGLVLAAHALGQIYEQGVGRKVDMQTAHSWFERAATGGSADAYFHLAKIHEHGLIGAVDTAKAVELYERAAELGNAAACLVLASAFETGRWNLEVNKTKSSEYLERHSAAKAAAKRRRDRMRQENSLNAR
jgi:TPR repeat protein